MGVNTEYNDNSLLEMFGLNYEQTLLLFSSQKMLAEYDYQITKSEKVAALKKEWIREWESSVSSYLDAIDQNLKASLYPSDELPARFVAEAKSSNNRTWYYIVALELLEFVAYFPLGTEKDKDFKKCKYDIDKTYDFIIRWMPKQGIISTSKLERLDKTYMKSVSHISGKTNKIIMKVLTVVAIAALAAAGAAVAAGSIAVAIFGSAFEGLSGAALVSACLAMAGGGAIAVGGAGMAGGVAAIAGGGALLGLAGGSAVVGATSKMLSTPEFAMSQSAKLETILKEVILNAQKDVVSAQKIISRYQEQIAQLSKRLTEMELADEKNKQDIKDLKKCIDAYKKAYKNMTVFASAYETGMNAEGTA